MRHALLVLATAVSGGAHAGNGTLNVGSGPGCQHASLIAAVAAAAPGTDIRIAAPTIGLGATLVLGAKPIQIIGGFSSCEADTPSGHTELQPGFTGAAVIDVSGSQPVELANLRIAGGVSPAGGGGLRKTGPGTLVLSNTQVLDNQAQDGGGLYVAGAGPASTVVDLRGDTRIGADGLGNLATRHGGGLWCSQARLRIGHAGIVHNRALDEGGGLHLEGCDLQPLEESGDSEIAFNLAREGGGIHATDGATLLLASDGDRKVRVHANQATEAGSPQRGGGALLSGAGTRMLASGVWWTDNRAVLGSGALSLSLGAQASFVRGTACAAGDDGCSRIEGNRAANAAGSGGNGGVAQVVAGATLTIMHTRLHANQAGNNPLFRINGVGSSVLLDNVLVSGQQTIGRLLTIESGAHLDADFLTLADNAHNGAAIDVQAGSTLAVQRSILQVGAGLAVVQGAGSIAAACNNASGGALGGEDHAPAFFSPASGHYRLRTDSQNLDRCASDGNEAEFDLSGLPRNRDRPGVANNIGPLDRGAYEDSEELLRSGFES